MTREMPIENGTLKSNLDAANKRIENLAAPVNPNDAVTKKYLEEHGTGKPVALDDDVTETSENGVKSKGIWSFVKELFGKLAAVATSGSYNDLTNKPKIPKGADVLTLDGQRVFKNGAEEITTYSVLLALVKAGGVVLLDTVAGTIAKEALFHPHMADETAIRFDATGTLGEKVYTRSFAFTPKAGSGIAVSRGDLTEVAKKIDVPAVVAPSSTATSGQAADAKNVYDALAGKQKKKIVFFVAIRSQDLAYLVDEYGNTISRNKYLELTENKTVDTTIDFFGVQKYHHIEGDVFRTSYSFENGKFSYYELNVEPERIEIVAINRQNIKDIEIDFASFAKSTDLADKLTDADLKTLCTACGISLVKDDGETPKTRAELLTDLFGESNSQLAKTIREKVLADGEGGIKTAFFTDTAFSAQVKKDANYAVVDTIENRSVKRVTISGDTAMTVILPKPTAESGVVDFEVWFDASAYTGTYPSIGYKYDATTDADVITKDGEDLAYGDGAVTIVHFTSVNGSAYTAVAASFKEGD